MRVLPVVLLLLASACSRKTDAPSGIDTAAGRARMLASMAPDGDLPVDRTIAGLQARLQKQPDKLDAWILLGEAWIRKARDDARPQLYANAGACADIALSLQPDNRAALDLRGLVLMNDHRFEATRALMQSVVDRTPADAPAWGTLSDALLELGRTGEAVTAAQRMMDLKPNLPSYSRAAHLQWLRGDVAAAKESLRLAIDAGQDGKDTEPRAWVMVQAAALFWNEGDYEGALAGDEAALRLLPDFPPALVGKARVLMARGEASAAAALLEQAYKANPLVQTGWYLYDARLLQGDAPGAGQLRAELQQHGRFADPRTLAAFLAAHDLERDEALRLALAERKTRDDAYTEDAIAWALYRAGKLEDALAASVKANQLGTRDALLWFHEGAIRLATGDKLRGRELLEKALKLSPHFDVTGEQEARRLLDVRMARAK